MGNCKSTSAAAAADSVVAVHHQKGEGYAGASTVTTHKKPLVQIQIDGNVEVPHGTLVLSPTADLSEATSKDSHDSSYTGNPSTVVSRCSVDDWIGTKPTLDEEEEEEKEENEEAGDNGSDFDDGMPPPPPGKPDSASKPSSAVANPTYKFVLPLMSGTIPASILQIASDYVMSEVNALTPVADDGEKTKSVWALDPTIVVAGATAALLGDDNAKASTEKTATTTTLIDAPFDEISVDGSDLDDEIDPAAVTLRYKQKASQWAVDEAVQGSLKRRGPRPEDSCISRRTLRR